LRPLPEVQSAGIVCSSHRRTREKKDRRNWTIFRGDIIKKYAAPVARRFLNRAKRLCAALITWHNQPKTRPCRLSQQQNAFLFLPSNITQSVSKYLDKQSDAHNSQILMYYYSKQTMKCKRTKFKYQVTKIKATDSLDQVNRVLQTQVVRPKP
jgi:hypothetical protein